MKLYNFLKILWITLNLLLNGAYFKFWVRNKMGNIFNKIFISIRRIFKKDIIKLIKKSFSAKIYEILSNRIRRIY